MKKRLLDYLGQVFLLFGVMVIMLMISKQALYDYQEVNAFIFDVDKHALSFQILMQFLALAAMNVMLKHVMFSEKYMKHASILTRTTLLVLSFFVIVVGFIVTFKWFPKGEILPWLLFVLLFAVSAFVSIGVVSIKTKVENKNMSDGLKSYQNKLEDLS